ncbi:MAG: hypothetical protein HFJ02_06090 [Bacilli bacterium]|nr:hypothetical protein [Bacilli bacterium]
MSLLYDQYRKLKERDKDTYYLFRSGNFYIFLGDDADRINQYVVLKRTPFCKETIKCGFPIRSLEAYLTVFKNHGLVIQVIEKEEKKRIEPILKDLKNLDIESITPIKALTILKEIKDSL